MPPLNKHNTCCLAGEQGSSEAKGENPDRKFWQVERPYGWKHSHPSGKVGQSPTFSKIFLLQKSKRSNAKRYSKQPYAQKRNMIIGTWRQTGLYITSHFISFSVGQCHEQSHKREKERNTMENDGKVRKS